MRMIKGMTALGLLLMIGLANGADQKAPPKPATMPAPKPDLPLLCRDMPAVDFQHKSLDQVLAAIKEKNPDFKFLIFRGPDVNADYPSLASLKLEDVTIGQFLELIENEYGAKCTWIRNPAEDYGVSNPKPSICEVDIRQQTAASEHVRVYGLGEIIDYRASLIKGDGDHQKQASDDVLSVIQEALDKAGATDSSALALHPPTQTLICRVTGEQAQVIEQVLAALRPSDADKTRLLDLAKVKNQELEASQRGLSAQMQLDRAVFARELDASIAKLRQAGGDTGPALKQLEALSAEMKPQPATQQSR
jgi:hypothetical protein